VFGATDESPGGPGDGPALHDAVTYAVGKGTLVVAASGNTRDDTPQYPGAYREVLAVGATDKAGAVITEVRCTDRCNGIT
jgi:subtilisin family serine protease